MSVAPPPPRAPTAARHLPVADGFSPFARADDERITHGLRSLLGHDDLRWSDLTPDLRDDIGQLAVWAKLESGVELAMEISARAQPERTALLRLARLADGRSPYADPASGPRARELVSAFRDGVKGGALDAVLAALARHREHARVPDWQYRRAVDGPGGPSGMLRLGFRCNQDCSFCWQGRDWPAPPPETYFAWLDELAAQGIDYLTITGGEPTLHEFLPDLIRRASGTHSMSVHLQTNAVRMRDARYCARLKDAGLASALISFHSADPTVSDLMTRAPRTHQATVRGIHNALETGLVVVLNCVVDRNNCDGLAAHASFIVEAFVNGHRDNPVRTVNYSHPSPYYEEVASRDAMVPLDLIEPQLVAAAGMLVCAGVAVHATGTCGFPLCVFRKNPELVAWRDVADLDARDMSARQFADSCEQCAARRQCVGLRREYLDAFGSRGVTPYLELPSVQVDADEVSPMQAVRNLSLEQR